MTEANTLMKIKRGRLGQKYQSRNCRECNRIYLAERRGRRAA